MVPDIKALPDGSPAPDPLPESTPAAVAIDPLYVLRVLLSAGGPLLTQVALHWQLARVEWAEQKIRFLKMVMATLLGFTSLLCAMIFVGGLIIASSWDTAYRIPGLLALVAIYALVTALAWRRFRTLSAESSEAFAATREELAADLALLRGNP